jgi:PAS domain S-box-containing protein
MSRRRDNGVVLLLAVALLASCAVAVTQIRSTLLNVSRRSMARVVEQHSRYIGRVVSSSGDPVPEILRAYAEYADDPGFERTQAGFLVFERVGDRLVPIASTALVQHLLSPEGLSRLEPELRAHARAATTETWVTRDHRDVAMMVAQRNLTDGRYVVVLMMERARVERPLLLVFVTSGIGVCSVLSLLFWSLWRARTGLTRSQRALERAAAHRAQLLDQMRSLLLSLDADGRVVEWNQGAARALGVTRAEAVGRELVALPIPWDPSVLLGGLVEARRSGRPVALDPIGLLREDGTSTQLGLTVSLVRDADGAPETWLVVGADITTKLQVETELRHSQKMRAIGQLAAGIAHEINTPAQFIGDNLRFLREEIGNVLEAVAARGAALRAAGAVDPCEGMDLDYLRQEMPAALEQSLDGISRVGTIVRAMKNVSHPDESPTASLDLHEVLETALTVSHNEWKLVASIEKRYAPELPAVRGVQTDLIQVVLNLVVNACHAIADAKREEGVIVVSTSASGDRVELRISDNGAGMSDEVRARIFEPFFTTKDVGRGTGQGLAIVYDIVVAKHGGTIDVESELGVGSTFVVGLPRVV